MRIRRLLVAVVSLALRCAGELVLACFDYPLAGALLALALAWGVWHWLSQ